VRSRYGEDAANGGAQPPVPRGGRQAGQAERDRDGDAEDVAVRRDDGDGEVPGVDVDGYDAGLSQFAQ
jgi:hypothetical protein